MSKPLPFMAVLAAAFILALSSTSYAQREPTPGPLAGLPEIVEAVAGEEADTIDVYRSNTSLVRDGDVMRVVVSHDITNVKASSVEAVRVDGSEVSQEILLRELASVKPVVLVEPGFDLIPSYAQAFRPETLILRCETLTPALTPRATPEIEGQELETTAPSVLPAALYQNRPAQ